MESEGRSLGSPSGVQSPTEERMLREDVVREMLARLGRGEGIKRIARELGVDRKTVKAWRARGAWRPRPAGGRRRGLDAFRSFVEQRGPEVGWNGVVLHRELQGLGFAGGYLCAHRSIAITQIGPS
jgi:putative ATPase subunit gpP of terminase